MFCYCFIRACGAHPASTSLLAPFLILHISPTNEAKEAHVSRKLKASNPLQIVPKLSLQLQRIWSHSANTLITALCETLGAGASQTMAGFSGLRAA